VKQFGKAHAKQKRTREEWLKYFSRGEKIKSGLVSECDTTTLFQETIIVPGYLCAVASLIGSAPPACAPCHRH
jgi:hypothetical protein